MKKNDYDDYSYTVIVLIIIVSALVVIGLQ